MVEKPTKKELIIFIVAMGLAIVLFVGALAWSGLANATGRHHSYPTPTVSPTIDPCQQGLTWETESPCVTPTIVLEEPTPTASPSAMPEVTSSSVAGESATVSDGRSDGLSSCPSCTQAPVRDQQGEVLSTSVGWK